MGIKRHFGNQSRSRWRRGWSVSAKLQWVSAQVTAVVENESLWADSDSIIKRAQKLENISSMNLNRCTLSVAALTTTTWSPQLLEFCTG